MSKELSKELFQINQRLQKRILALEERCQALEARLNRIEWSRADEQYARENPDKLPKWDSDTKWQGENTTPQADKSVQEAH